MRALLPPILLVVVALAQIGLAHTVSLSPWFGGGFGMFSSQDAGSKRHLHVFALHAGVRRELELPAELRDEIARALTLPTPERLRALAERFGAQDDPDFGTALALELQVFGTRFDPVTLEPSGVLLRSIEAARRARSRSCLARSAAKVAWSVRWSAAAAFAIACW